MSALNSPIDLKNISPMVKEVTKEWMREILASDESEDRYDSIRNLYKKFNEALMKEYGDKGSECVNQKFGELKPQVDFLASLFYCINDDLRNRQRETIFCMAETSTEACSTFEMRNLMLFLNLC